MGVFVGFLILSKVDGTGEEGVELLLRGLPRLPFWLVELVLGFRMPIPVSALDDWLQLRIFMLADAAALVADAAECFGYEYWCRVMVF